MKLLVLYRHITMENYHRVTETTEVLTLLRFLDGLLEEC